MAKPPALTSGCGGGRRHCREFLVRVSILAGCSVRGGRGLGPSAAPVLMLILLPNLALQVRYKEEFEKNKGKGFSVVADTPELQRIKKTQDQISNVRSLACCGTPTASRPPARLGDSCQEGRKGLGFPLVFFLCTPIFHRSTLGPHGTSTGKALSFCTGRACVLKLSPPTLSAPPPWLWWVSGSRRTVCQSTKVITGWLGGEGPAPLSSVSGC